MAAACALREGCAHCQKRENLVSCAPCRSVLYCNDEHQIADRWAHRWGCQSVSGSRRICEVLEDSARSKLSPNVPWETACRLGLDRTRTYIMPRIIWAAALARVKTVQAAQEALGHYLDIQHLLQCEPSNDPHLVHSRIPMLMLRLNRDRECYKWVRNWAIASVESLDLDEQPKLYEDLNNADVFEDNGPLWRLTKEIAVVATVALLKIKLVIDLEALGITTSIVGPKVPLEIPDHIRRYYPASPIIAENHKILHSDNHQEVISDLTDQICFLVKRVRFLRHAYSSHLAPFLAAACGIEANCSNIRELANYSRSCWKKVPGAKDFVSEIE